MPLHAAVIQKLVSTNSHLGRRITTHDLKPYLHGTRNSLSILDSDKTLISIRTALSFISHLIRTRTRSRPANFLFVNTNPLYDRIFHHLTRLTSSPPFLSPQSQFWRRTGFLTNPHSPKRFRGRGKRLCFSPVDPPDCLVVVDPDFKCSVISEAHRVGVPVVAIVDSRTPFDVFTKIAYPIVCAAESVQFVYLFCNLIAKTFLLENKLAGGSHLAVDVDDHLVDEILASVKDDNHNDNDNAAAVDGVVADQQTVNANAEEVEGVAVVGNDHHVDEILANVNAAVTENDHSAVSASVDVEGGGPGAGAAAVGDDRNVLNANADEGVDSKQAMLKGSSETTE